MVEGFGGSACRGCGSPLSTHGWYCLRCTFVREDPALLVALEAAVPAWILSVSKHSAWFRDLILVDWRAAYIADDGPLWRSDDMRYGHKKLKRGEVARLFNDFARGLAALAHQQGGVSFMGMVWCASHAPGGVVVSGDRTGRCGRCLNDGVAVA